MYIPNPLYIRIKAAKTNPYFYLRPLIWISFLKGLIYSSFTGLGFENLYFIGQLNKLKFASTVVKYSKLTANPHNTFLKLLLEQGILISGLLFYFIFLYIKKVFVLLKKTQADTDNYLNNIFIFLFPIYILFAVFDNLLWIGFFYLILLFNYIYISDKFFSIEFKLNHTLKKIISAVICIFFLINLNILWGKYEKKTGEDFYNKNELENCIVYTAAGIERIKHRKDYQYFAELAVVCKYPRNPFKIIKKVYQNALKNYPFDSVLQEKTAQIDFLQGHYNESLYHLKLANNFEPNNAVRLRLLSISYENFPDKEKYIFQCLRRIKRIEPNYAAAYKELIKYQTGTKTKEIYNKAYNKIMEFSNWYLPLSEKEYKQVPQLSSYIYEKKVLLGN